MNRNFHLSDILTVTTGKMLSTSGIIGLYAILNHITQQSVYTHQIPSALKICKPALLKQYPDLEQVEYTGTDYQTWLNEQISRFGSELAVESLDNCEWKDPLEELEQMHGK
jgi:hypothetical protein